jgi:hypothetical protein
VDRFFHFVWLLILPGLKPESGPANSGRQIPSRPAPG